MKDLHYLFECLMITEVLTTNFCLNSSFLEILVIDDYHHYLLLLTLLSVRFFIYWVIVNEGVITR